jgi:DNA recombination-dependent growth factor C
MGIQSPTASISRYRVEGNLEKPMIETVRRGLKSNTIEDIDKDSVETSVGWTSFHQPYQPNFEGPSFIFGTFFVFSLRIDKKTLPPKLLHKHFMLAGAKRLADTGQRYLSRSEKQVLKEQVASRLMQRMPATPHVHELIWNPEGAALSFFTSLKAANEELETLFVRSFGVSLIRLFPYTTAEFSASLTDSERDILQSLKPTDFTKSF